MAHMSRPTRASVCCEGPWAVVRSGFKFHLTSRRLLETSRSIGEDAANFCSEARAKSDNVLHMASGPGPFVA